MPAGAPRSTGGAHRTYWISPFQYLLNAVVVNEMTSPSWSQPYPGFSNEGQVRLPFFVPHLLGGVIKLIQQMVKIEENNDNR